MKSSNRWTTCWRVWAVLAVATVAIELGGYRHQGITMQGLLGLSILMGGGFAVAWACHKGGQLLLLYASGALAVAAGELALRVTESRVENPWRPLFQFDSTLGWRFVPGASVDWSTNRERHSHVRINSAGFRDSEFDGSDKNGGSSIIAMLGDSFVANINVDSSEIFTELMRQSLQPEWDVRNFGVPGYGQVQQLLLLEELLETQKPAVACVVVYLGNDFEDNLGDAGVRGYRRPRCALHPDGKLEILADLKESDQIGEHRSIHSLIAATRLYGLATNAVRRFHPDHVSDNRLPYQLRYHGKEWGESQAHAWEIMRALFGSMAHLCEQHQCQFAVVLAPCRWQVDKQEWQRIVQENRLNPDEFDRSKPNQVISSFCAEHGYPCLDLLPQLERYVDQDERLYFETDEHWSAHGQARVAEALTDWMRHEEKLTQHSVGPE